MASGVSAYYMDQGIKVSKIYKDSDQVLYWYCDIFQIKQGSDPNTIVFEDLLIDVIVYEDGTLKIMDLDEFADALELGLISKEEATYAIRILDRLLNIINLGEFDVLKAPIDQAEAAYSSSSI
jgi:predicted RNA-binding protein associated with RNAse of E/G family